MCGWQGVSAVVLRLAMLFFFGTTSTRRWTLAALSGLLLTLAAGAAVGKRKDHRLRFLMVPLMVGVACCSRTGLPGAAAGASPANPVRAPVV